MGVWMASAAAVRGGRVQGAVKWIFTNEKKSDFPRNKF
jgi:hypothetical protein